MRVFQMGRGQNQLKQTGRTRENVTNIPLAPLINRSYKINQIKIEIILFHF